MISMNTLEDAYEAYLKGKCCANCSHSTINGGPCKIDKVCDFYSTYS